MATWKSAAYDGRYLQLDISESVNVGGNSSTLSWTLTSTGGASTYYTIDTTTVTINGTTVYSKGRTYWDDRVFPAKKGSVSGTITVAHDSNGSKTITVGFSTRVYIFGPQEYGGNMTLTTIDRSAPTVTFSTSNVTANGFKISATSSATADIWQYSTNGGSNWTQFSTTASTSASVTLSSLSPNTSYTVKVRARRQYNHVYGTSGSSTVKTLGGAVVNSVNTVTADKEHYEKLHPANMSFDNRMRCLKDLKTLGFQVGCGFMVGSPYQTAKTLAKDLKFVETFSPDMCGIGPFIPQKDTPFGTFTAGTAAQTVYLLSLIRLIKPNILLPSTTALGTVDPKGREKGIQAGANVVMPNLSPVSVRKKYALYDDKICTGDESAQCRACLAGRMRSIGFEVVTARGDIIS